MTARAPLYLDANGAQRQLSAAAGDTIDPAIAPGVKGLGIVIATTAASQIVPSPPSPYALTVSTASGITAKAQTAATASTTYTLKKNGTQVASIVWSASATLGVASLTSGAFSVAVGDVLTLNGPATADSSLAAISVSVVGS